VIVAVSGGSDSLALAAATGQWLGRGDAPAGAGALACIVDHGLRAGSAEDADAARQLCGQLGLGAVVRRAEGLASASGIAASRLQERARLARHRLLAEEAARFGARLILLGHTADDQAETVAMRLLHRTGLEGLAGMAAVAPSPLWRAFPDAVIARPLLDQRRAALRQGLTDAGLAWLDDPANASPAFERVRIRARLAQLDASGADVAALARLANHARQLREAFDRAALAGLTVAADKSTPTLSLPPGTGDLAARQLALACAAVGDAARVPDLAQTAALLPRLAAGAAVTLAGALVRPSGPRWLVSPAPKRRVAAETTGRPVTIPVSIPLLDRAACLAGLVPQRAKSSMPPEQPLDVGERELHEGGATVVALT
jgi:tRNA(Ile)-lysidine synthase